MGIAHDCLANRPRAATVAHGPSLLQMIEAAFAAAGAPPLTVKEITLYGQRRGPPLSPALGVAPS